MLKNHHLFQEFVEQGLDIAFCLDSNGIITYISPQIKRYGYNQEDIIDRPFGEFVYPEDREGIFKDFEKTIKTGQEFPTVFRIVNKEGEVFWLEDHGAVKRDKSGAITGIMGFLRDITKQKHAEIAIRESEQKFKAIFDNATDGILVAHADSKQLISANPAICRMLGYTLEELLRLTAADLHLKDQLGYVMAYFDKMARGAISMAPHIPFLRKDGDIFDAEISSSRIELSGQPCMLGIIRDLTERNRLQRQIAEVSDYEQRRIGFELHDGLQQELIGLAFKCETLAEILFAKKIPEADEIQKVGDLLDRAVAHTRDLSKLLCPVDEASRNSLTCALEELAEKTESLFTIRCLFKSDGSFSFNNSTVTNNLYRISQEAVTNAVKHGQAKHILIHLSGSQKKVCLMIKDDGTGLPPNHHKTQGMGLHIMKYRAAVIGATFSVRKDLEIGGTVVMCSLPSKHLWEQNHENKTE